MPPPSQDAKSARCLTAMMRMNIADNSDGSLRLYACACRAVEHDLDDPSALRVIPKYIQQRPFAQVWTDDEILQRIRDAEKHTRRGRALELDADGCIPLGERDPETGRVVLSPRRTLPTADAYVREFQFHPEGRTFHNHSDLLMEWQGNCYRKVEDQAIRKKLQCWLHDSLRYVIDRESKQPTLVPFDSNPTTVNAALDTIRAHVHLPETTPTPSWLVSDANLPPPTEILPCRSVLLHLPTMRRMTPTPAFFTSCALDFDHDSDAPPPMAWFDFLHQIFDGDSEALDLLQDWLGYCLTGDTSQQKMLLMVGPRRSGKGTVARVLTRLIGPLNVCGPTTSGLAGPFGLQPLIDKSLAIVSDARFHGENIATVVERLLCISGEDTLTIDRKFLTSVTMKLPTRFMFLTNEFPRLTDASGALAGRFVILQLTKSFYGQEDPTLTNRLLKELPGILNWAIKGWHNLHQRGHFVMPASVEDAVRQIEDLSSPVTAFVREKCSVATGNRVTVAVLYAAWRRWCEEEGRKNVGTVQTFDRDLVAAVPSVVPRRNHASGRFYEGIELKRPGASNCATTD